MSLATLIPRAELRRTALALWLDDLLLLATDGRQIAEEADTNTQDADDLLAQIDGAITHLRAAQMLAQKQTHGEDQ
jgi:hypothetical protein